MSDKQLDARLKSLDDVVVSQVYLVEAMLLLLEEKGILTTKEVTEKVEEIKKKRSA
ncbi:MAG: hypothetical protein HY788_13485 [Deltaproteobacteria bacterium]|nr:hypothetical protein [Deltaproteobacteria bacterium]